MVESVDKDRMFSRAVSCLIPVSPSPRDVVSLVNQQYPERKSSYKHSSDPFFHADLWCLFSTTFIPLFGLVTLPSIHWSGTKPLTGDPYSDRYSTSRSQSYGDLDPPAPPTRLDSSSSSHRASLIGGAAGIAAAPSLPQMQQTGMAYQNIPSESYWPENKTALVDLAAERTKATRNKWLTIGAIVFAVLAVIGIVVGVTVSQVTKKKSGGGGNGGQSNSGGGGNSSDLGDPSQFDKDSRLHQSFWGFAYTPQVSHRRSESTLLLIDRQQ